MNYENKNIFDYLIEILQPNRHQVESRLNQIRDYIRVTSTMMESLSQSNDPVSIQIIIHNNI